MALKNKCFLFFSFLMLFIFIFWSSNMAYALESATKGSTDEYTSEQYENEFTEDIEQKQIEDEEVPKGYEPQKAIDLWDYAVYVVVIMSFIWLFIIKFKKKYISQRNNEKTAH